MLIKNVFKVARTKFLSPMASLLNQINERQIQIENRLDLLQKSLGRVELRQLINSVPSNNLNDYEYQVFSQWGEDGIIQFLIDRIGIERKIFVEFGVESYKQANTRFLLVNNNWAGLVIDGCEENIQRIKYDHVYYNYNLKAIKSFVTKDNINDLLVQNGLTGEIGLLSVDVDGNDYWIWEAIDSINPVIVIAEYNYRFGVDEAVTIPYQEDFVRSEAHHSMIYFGASLKALCLLANKKGYTFVGCCSNGVNAFFVRKDKKPSTILELSPEDGYKSGFFCETRNSSGAQVKTSPEDEILLLKQLALPIVKVD
jgi:hypothetical protein